MNSKQSRPSVTRPGARSASGGAGGPSKPARPARPGSAPRPSRISKAIGALKPDAATQERLSGIRMNLRTIVILALVVLGLFALYPQTQLLFAQRQQISQLQQEVAASKANLAKMKVNLNRWADPVYIRSQARDRLYYVLPGEVSYLVMGANGISNSDVSGTVGAKLAQQRASTRISASVTRAKKNWVNSIMQSVMRAGLDEPLSSGGTTSVGK